MPGAMPVIAEYPGATKPDDAGKLQACQSSTDSSGTTAYSSAKLLAGQIPVDQAFIDAIWNESPNDYLAFAFALDSSLALKKGWDNATDYGTPQDVLAFVTAAPAAAK